MALRPHSAQGRVESSLGYDPFNQLVDFRRQRGRLLQLDLARRTGHDHDGSSGPVVSRPAVDFYKGWLNVTVENASTTVTACDPARKMLTLAAPWSSTCRWASYSPLSTQ